MSIHKSIQKIIAILEILFLVIILLNFSWARFDGKLSMPFYLEPTPFRIFTTSGIAIVVILRLVQVGKYVITSNRFSKKSQFIVIGLYVLMIGTDLYEFGRWKYYADMYGFIIITLLTPVLLGILNNIKSRKTDT